MRRYRSLILIVLLGISMIGFSRDNNRNNNGRPGNYSNNGRPGGNQNQNNGNNRPGNNSRPGNNNNSTNDRNPGWNNNGSHNSNTGNSGKYCVEKKKNSNQCIRYENYNGSQLPNKPPKL